MDRTETTEGEHAAGARIAGRYVLDRLLGEGAFGQVWAAHDDKAFQRRVAVKFLLRRHVSNNEIVARFWREGRATAALEHANVVTLLEFGEEGGLPYLVSEFVDGESLRSMIERHARNGAYIPLEWVRALFRQICAAVSAAHAKGIVHRDLKPENVMVQGEWPSFHVKVLDFGIARILSNESEVTQHAASKTQIGRVIGSLQYMSPEQVTGAVDEIDERTDVFALSAVLFEMLTLQPAFHAPSFMGVMVQILESPRPRLSKIRSEAGEALDEVLERGMAVHKPNRIASVIELADQADDAFDSVLGPSTAGRSSRRSSLSEVEALVLQTAQTRPTQLTGTPLESRPEFASTADDDGPRAVPPRRGPSIWLGVGLGVLIVAGTIVGLRWYEARHDREARSRSVPTAPDAATQADRADVTLTARAAPDAGALAERSSSDAASDVTALDAVTVASRATRTPADHPRDWLIVQSPASRVRLGAGPRAAPAHVWRAEADAGFEGPAFEIHVHEVTWQRYEAWVGDDASRAVSPPSWIPTDRAARQNLPVVNVRWENARAYCQALGGDLPTEEQWEYAARGATARTDPWRGVVSVADLGVFRPDRAHLVATGSRTVDVTPEGVHDLAANAREWTLSVYRTDQGESPAWTATLRTVRGLPLRENPPPGGGRVSSALYRSSGCVGSACLPGDLASLEDVGFRCARNVGGSRDDAQ